MPERGPAGIRAALKKWRGLYRFLRVAVPIGDRGQHPAAFIRIVSQPV